MVEIFQRIGRTLEVRDIDKFENQNDDVEEPIFELMHVIINCTFMISHKTHKNIIWNPNFIINHIFLSTFVENNAIQFTFFLDF